MPKLVVLFLKYLVDQKNYLFCILITLLGAALRIYHYDSLPPFNWTKDEFAFAWSGMSLLKDHEPTSWSLLDPTDDFLVVVWEKTAVRFRFVTPWFDHPPLFGLIVGMAAILGGAKEFFDCTLAMIRVPSLIFGIASIILFYILSLKLFNTSVAVISSLIFATNPNTVFLSRLAVSENLILLLSLVIVLYFLEYTRNKEKKYLYLAACLAGIASLVKVTGLFLVAILVTLLILQKKWREGLLVAVIGGLIFSLYFAYGWLYDFEWFKIIFQDQSNRFIDFGILKYIILPTVFFEDGWLILAWLTLLLILRSHPNKFSTQLIAVPILLYSLLLVSSGAQSHFYAWYMIPFYPFLFLALGNFLDDFRKNPDLMSAGLIFIFLGVWSIQINLAQRILASPYGKIYFMIGTAVILGIFLIDYLNSRKTQKLTNIAMTIMFISLIIANIITVYKYQIN